MPSVRILVTGGAGFIGSHLCERLLAFGHEVRCVDDLSSGSLENIEDLLQNERFGFTEADVSTVRVGFIPDQIYNLACPASPVQYQREPITTTRTSVLGAMNMLDLAWMHGARILQASTSEVYGDPAIHPQEETYWGNVNPIGPRSCYDEGKRCAETLFTDYRRQYGLDARIARIFNTYGPRMQPDDGRVVSNFICQALQGKPLTIYGNGGQTRSFCYVSDMVEGLIRLMDADGDVSLPVNLGNPHEVTILNLARSVISYVGLGTIMAFRNLPEDDPSRRRPSISRAKELLRWSPKVSLDAGLKNTIAYFKERLDFSSFHGTPASKPYHDEEEYAILTH